MIDWITGEKFISIADFMFASKTKASGDYNNLVNTFNLDSLFNKAIIYTHTMYVKELFAELSKTSKSVYLITHNCDYAIDETYKLPENVIHWFAQNVNVIDERISSIPIGLENQRWFPEQEKKLKMTSKLKEYYIMKNLLYVNFNEKTNPSERAGLYNKFKTKSFATVENIGTFDNYIDQIYNHNFVLCPEGNGIDTHRTWEALYMGCIPIEKRNINNQFYKNLPISFVDSWDEITEEFLKSELKRIANTEWRIEKLNFEYWNRKIKWQN